MKKTILFVMLKQYADWEGAYLSSLIQLLGQGQYVIKTVSLAKDNVQSIGGLYTVVDYDMQSIPDDYEAVILIGGLSWRNEEANKVRPLVEACLKKEKVLGAICDGTTFLGAMGVLNNVRHTSNELNDLKKWAGQAYTGEEKYVLKQAVRDERIITANGTAALEFAKEVMLALNVAEEEKIVEWYNFHKLGYYSAPMPTM